MVKITQVEAISADELRQTYSEILAKVVELQNKVTPPNKVDFIPQLQLVKELSTTVPTIIALRKRGILKAYRLGQKVYYKRHEVEAALIQISGKTSNE